MLGLVLLCVSMLSILLCLKLICGVNVVVYLVVMCMNKLFVLYWCSGYGGVFWYVWMLLLMMVIVKFCCGLICCKILVLW